MNVICNTIPRISALQEARGCWTPWGWLQPTLGFWAVCWMQRLCPALQYWNNRSTFRDVIRAHTRRRKTNCLIYQPSGMSSDITASSAMIHKQMLTKRGYSSLQSSARCFPIPKLTNDIHGFGEVMCLIAFSGFDVQRSTWMWNETCLHSKVGS